MTCPNGHPNPEDQHFCGECGAPLTNAAPRTGPSKTPSGKSTTVRCHKCQHVQAVPLSQPIFVCEKCNTQLKRVTSKMAAPKPSPKRSAPKPSPKQFSEAERSAVLDHHLVLATGRGGHVETRSATEAVVVYGKPVNHVLHLLLTVFTLVG